MYQKVLHERKYFKIMYLMQMKNILFQQIKLCNHSAFEGYSVIQKKDVYPNEFVEYISTLLNKRDLV
jgi:hypothetical protein